MEEIKKFYKNKNILITGVTGFKGSWLCLMLTMFGAKVLGLGYKPNKNENLFNSLNLKKKIRLKFADIRDFKKLKKILHDEKPEIVFHLAAQPLILRSYIDPFETINTNSSGTLNILEILRKFKSIKSIICVTSDKCYSNNHSTRGFKETDHLGGSDPYSASKASAEIIIKAYYDSFYKKTNTGLASARAGNVIGGGDWSANRLIPDTIKSIKNNKIIYLRNPNFNRPWQHVLEPVFGYVLLAKKLYEKPKKYSEAWNFGSKKNTVTSVHEVVKKITKFWGRGKIKVKKSSKFYEQKNLQLNITKAKKILKWQPTYSISKTIIETAAWYKGIIEKKYTPEFITKKQIASFLEHVKFK